MTTIYEPLWNGIILTEETVLSGLICETRQQQSPWCMQSKRKHVYRKKPHLKCLHRSPLCLIRPYKHEYYHVTREEIKNMRNYIKLYKIYNLINPCQHGFITRKS